MLPEGHITLASPWKHSLNSEGFLYNDKCPWQNKPVKLKFEENMSIYEKFGTQKLNLSIS